MWVSLFVNNRALDFSAVKSSGLQRSIMAAEYFDHTPIGGFGSEHEKTPGTRAPGVLRQPAGSGYPLPMKKLPVNNSLRNDSRATCFLKLSARNDLQKFETSTVPVW